MATLQCLRWNICYLYWNWALLHQASSSSTAKLKTDTFFYIDTSSRQDGEECKDFLRSVKWCLGFKIGRAFPHVSGLCPFCSYSCTTQIWLKGILSSSRSCLSRPPSGESVSLHFMQSLKMNSWDPDAPLRCWHTHWERVIAYWVSFPMLDSVQYCDVTVMVTC